MSFPLDLSKYEGMWFRSFVVSTKPFLFFLQFDPSRAPLPAQLPSHSPGTPSSRSQLWCQGPSQSPSPQKSSDVQPLPWGEPPQVSACLEAADPRRRTPGPVSVLLWHCFNASSSCPVAERAPVSGGDTEEPEPEQQLPAPEQKCLAAAFGDGQEIVSWWGFLFFLLLLLLWTSPISSLRHLTYLVPS